MAVIHCGETGFSNISAVIFDKDGTLADSQDFLRTLAQRRARLLDAQVPGVQDPLLMAFGVEGSRLNPQGLMAVGTRYENEIAAAAYVAETGRAWSASLELARRAFNEADSGPQQKAQLTPPYAGTQDMLANLKAAGLRTGVLSSDSTENVKDFLSYHQLAAYVDVAQGTGPTDPAKPNPELLLQMCDQLNVAPTQVLVIGDSEIDQKLAHNARAAGFVLVAWAASATPPQAADAVLQAWSQLQVYP